MEPIRCDGISKLCTNHVLPSRDGNSFSMASLEVYWNLTFICMESLIFFFIIEQRSLNITCTTIVFGMFSNKVVNIYKHIFFIYFGQ